MQVSDRLPKSNYEDSTIKSSLKKKHTHSRSIGLAQNTTDLSYSQQGESPQMNQH